MKQPLLLALTLASAGIAPAQAATYAIDPRHTSVMFEILHRGTSTIRGRFEKKEGSVSFDSAGKTGKAEITIDIKSVSTGVPSLDQRLLKEDLFNTDKHPTATFVSDKFNFNGSKVTEVTGALTFLGKTQPVTLKATNFNCYDNPVVKRETCGGDFETIVVRSAHGMNYDLPGGVDNIRVVIQIEAIKQ